MVSPLCFTYVCLVLFWRKPGQGSIQEPGVSCCWKPPKEGLLLCMLLWFTPFISLQRRLMACNYISVSMVSPYLQECVCVLFQKYPYEARPICLGTSQERTPYLLLTSQIFSRSGPDLKGKPHLNIFRIHSLCVYSHLGTECMACARFERGKQWRVEQIGNYQHRLLLQIADLLKLKLSEGVDLGVMAGNNS